MRPVLLRARAFGPFAGRIELDFRPALSRRLFGIYGPTGAGKTSILDAICFALFGASSGGERTRAHLRSDLADPETPTIVEFVFELGERRYFITREPEQELRSTRRSLRAFPARAAVFDATDIAPEDITLDHPGVPLAERKVREVDEAISRLLGYSADQFRQIVVLPQGRFRDLLTASSDRRSQILRGLFDVGVFERFCTRLREEARSLEDEVRQTRAQVEAALAENGVQSLGALRETAGALAADLQNLRERKPLLQAQLEAARSGWLAGQQLAGRIEEKRLAKEGLQALLLEQPRIDHCAERLRRARAARDITPYLNALDRAQKGQATQLKRLEDLDLEIAGLGERAQKADARLKLSLDAAPDRELLAKEVEAARGTLDRVLRTAPLRDDCATAGQEADTAENALTAAQERTERARHALEAAQAARRVHDEALVRHTALVREEGDLKRDLEQALGHDRAQKRIRDSDAGRLTARQDLEACVAAAETARNVLAELQDRTRRSQAQELAQQLGEGEPCPVCGSTSHPALANAPELYPGLESEALARARADAEAAESELDRARLGLAAAQARHAEALAASANLATPDRNAADLTIRLQEIQEALRGLEGAAAAASAGANRAMEAEREAEAARMGLSQAEAEASRRRARLEAAELQLERELAEVPPPLREQDAAERHLQALRARLEAAVRAHEDAEAEVANIERLVERSEAARREVQATLVGAQADTHEAVSALEAERLRLAVTQEDLRLGAEDRERIGELEEAIETHVRSLAAARDRLARLETELSGVTPPDLAALGQSLEAATKALSDNAEKRAETDMRLQARNGAIARLEALEDRRTAAESAYATTGELSRLTQGQNVRRISLPDYAITAYFDDVLAAANLRFHRMSQGRFELRRKQTVEDQRSRAGLDLLVFDAHSGRERDAQTLSGGEGFMAALALALGLADVVQAESGGVRLDAIFIDEGFGHLDDMALERALDTLREMVGEARAVGVISHVEAVKAQIPAGFEVLATVRGSQARARGSW